MDAKILFIYSGGRSKKSNLTGYYAYIKEIQLKHKSKIKGKENSETEFYYEVELESNFKINKKIKAELNQKLLFNNSDKKNTDLFQQFLPALTTLNKVLEMNSISSL